jgi:hypothetical protein
MLKKTSWEKHFSKFRYTKNPLVSNPITSKFPQIFPRFYASKKLPCKYGSNLHIISPNTKSLKIAPTRVNGMQNTPKNKSETAKFNKNKLVIVRIRLFCTRVNITREFPITANKNITEYIGMIRRNPVSILKIDTFALSDLTLKLDDVKFSLSKCPIISVAFDSMLIYNK